MSILFGAHSGNIKRTGLPDGWAVHTPCQALAPRFKLAARSGERLLMAEGFGNPDCLGWLSTAVAIQRGRTYRLSVKFRITGGLDPMRSLLFSFYDGSEFNDGIIQFKREDDWITGDRVFTVPGEGEADCEVRFLFRYSARGRAYLRDISLTECDPPPARTVRIAVSNGRAGRETWLRVIDTAREMDAQIVLLPEYFHGSRPEAMDGDAATLMADAARRNKIFVAGEFIHNDAESGRIYNAGVLYDRQGNLSGYYRKNHPYTAETFEGITPGTDVPVFDTELGRIGFMICYDSWFSDVAELLALKGAELILFPSASYYRSLMPARSADNCVRIAASSQDTACGIWDTSGAEAANPDVDCSRYANCTDAFCDVETRQVSDVTVQAATLDLNLSPSPHNWGGPMLSAPGGRRNRRDQKQLLLPEIMKESNRWWID